MKKVLILFVMLFALSSGNAQAKKEVPQVQSSIDKVEGTYQIQVVNSRNKPYVPSDIEGLVVKNRQANEVKYLSLGTEVRLMILPVSAINAPGFKAVPKIAHIKE